MMCGSILVKFPGQQICENEAYQHLSHKSINEVGSRDKKYLQSSVMHKMDLLN